MKNKPVISNQKKKNGKTTGHLAWGESASTHFVLHAIINAEDTTHLNARTETTKSLK